MLIVKLELISNGRKKIQEKWLENKNNNITEMNMEQEKKYEIFCGYLFDSHEKKHGGSASSIYWMYEKLMLNTHEHIY